jgi:hypothetical protein
LHDSGGIAARDKVGIGKRWTPNCPLPDTGLTSIVEVLSELCPALQRLPASRFRTFHSPAPGYLQLAQLQNGFCLCAEIFSALIWFGQAAGLIAGIFESGVAIPTLWLRSL